MGDRHDHVVPARVYVAVFAALMVLTAITVWASGQDFGPMNTAVALAIAITKATLVVLFFMHVKYAHERMTKVVIAAAFFFLLLLLALSMTDYTTRYLA